MSKPQLELQRVRAALMSGDAKAAARLCDKLLIGNPRDVDARYLHGRSLAALGRWNEAAAAFRRVLAANATFLPAMVDLGIAAALLGNHDEARLVLEKARGMDSRPAELHFGLGLAYLAAGEHADAIQAFGAALERNPAFPDAHNNLGVAYDRAGRLTDAAAAFRQAIAMYPEHADAHRNLGDMASRSGDLATASAAFARVVELRPADAGAHADLGAVELAAGDYGSAVTSFEQALRLDPHRAVAAANLGEALRRLNQPDRSAVAFRRAMSVDSAHAPAALGLGRLAAARGEAEAAATYFEAAARHDPSAAIALAAAAELEQLAFSSDALAVLQKAVQAHPNNADVQDSLGAALHRLGRLPDALDCYERALALDEHRPQTLLNCGHVLEAMGALSRAIGCFEQVLAERPADAGSLASIASCAFRLCDWDLVDRTMARLRALPDGIDELQSFLMLAADLDPGEVSASLERRARVTEWPTAPPFSVPAPSVHPNTAPLDPAPPHPSASHPPPPNPARASLGAAFGDRLRVAYVSPDLRVHPVAYAIAGLIEHHDRSRIAPIAISLKKGDGSDIESRLKASFEEFHDVSAQSDREVVTLMRERRIDIAIDLAGLTTGARTRIFSMRAAPVQVNFLGFPGSMGMDCIDFIIADQTVVPTPDDRFYAEKVLRMPHCYLPFDDSRLVPQAGCRAAAGLPAEGFVFCAFNNGYKITRAIFDVWMSLLRDVPDSVLWLRSMGNTVARTLKQAAEHCGVSAGRVIVAPFEADLAAHLARLRFADLFLDSSPYNAHTTGAEALWAGVPLITCVGKAFAGRVGASLLHACGFPELVCADLDAYRALALHIARTPSLHAELRARLHRSRHGARAFDTKRYARDFEELLQHMARRDLTPVEPMKGSG